MLSYEHSTAVTCMYSQQLRLPAYSPYKTKPVIDEGRVHEACPTLPQGTKSSQRTRKRGNHYFNDSNWLVTHASKDSVIFKPI